MSEIIKQRIISHLCDEIECLNPTNLELVGHNVINILENRRLIHHGINKDYKPVGHTVDSFSDDSKVIAEYSSHSNYFEKSEQNGKNAFVKIEADIKHALEHISNPNKIYLISSQLEPPSFRSEFNKLDIVKKYNNILVLYDCRELANLIHKQSIENPDAFSFYKQFFPGYALDFENHEYYGKVPAFSENHQPNIKTVQQLYEHFTSNNICILHGLSGSGKTQVAIEFLHSYKSNFDNYLWISGDDWKQNNSLASIQRTRGGYPINVSGLFNSSKTLLIIDDLSRQVAESDFNELRLGFSKEGKILITSQTSIPNNKNYIAIPKLTNSLAFKILGEDSENQSELSKNVVKVCCTSPLILTAIRNVIKEENLDKDEFYEEILENPADIRDDNGRSIIIKILDKLDSDLLNALKNIANSQSPVHDSEFLKHYIGSSKRSALQRLSFLLPADIPDFLKIHDLIYYSIKDGESVDSLIALATEKYIQAKDASMTPNMLRQIHLCLSGLLAERKQRGKDDVGWITYAILQIEGREREEIQEYIYSKKIDGITDISHLLCLIDAKEAHAYTITNEKEKADYFKTCAIEYERAKLLDLGQNIKIELLHHLGKAYRRSGEPEKALDCFQELLVISPNMHATYLQIIHLGSQNAIDKKFKTEGEKYIRKLFESVFNDFTTVPLRVSLGAITRLRSYKYYSKELDGSNEAIQKIASVISQSSFEGLGQFFEAFVSFTSNFGYHHSEECLKLIKSVPELISLSTKDVDKWNWINACEGLTNLAIAAIRQNEFLLSAKIATASVSFAEKLSEKQELDAYTARAIAKSYVAAELYSKALDVTEKVPEEKHDHWLLYQKAKAEIQLNSKNAYASSERAFQLAQIDESGKARISIYYDILSQSADIIGKRDIAIQHLKSAVNNCKDEVYKNELKVRLELLKEDPFK